MNVVLVVVGCVILVFSVVLGVLIKAGKVVVGVGYPLLGFAAGAALTAFGALSGPGEDAPPPGGDGGSSGNSTAPDPTTPSTPSVKLCTQFNGYESNFGPLTSIAQNSPDSAFEILEGFSTERQAEVQARIEEEAGVVLGKNWYIDNGNQFTTTLATWMYFQTTGAPYSTEVYRKILQAAAAELGGTSEDYAIKAKFQQEEPSSNFMYILRVLNRGFVQSGTKRLVGSNEYLVYPSSLFASNTCPAE